MAYELTDFEKKLICQNSIERVINTSMHVALRSRHEDAGVNLEDWRELKQLVTKLWDRERNEIFKEQLAEKEKRETLLRDDAFAKFWKKNLTLTYKQAWEQFEAIK